jgi:putative ABC transport system permease protein
VISPRWRKVLRDLWGHRARTFLVILSILVGVTALGIIGTTYVIIARDLPAGYNAASPMSARLFTDPFDDELVQVLKNLSGVGEVEGRRTLTARIKVTLPNGDVQWRDIDLFAIPDYEGIKINKISPEQGAFPPGEREILIERAALPLTGAQIGDTITIRMPNETERELPVTGTVHDTTRPSATFVNRAYGYVGFDTLEWLGAPQSYNELLFTVKHDALNRAHALEVARDVRYKVEKSGRAVYFSEVPNPGKHPFERFITPMVAILTFLGLLTMILSGFLVVNTISALLAQQVRQIGVMKAVGARSGQIAGMYLVMVLFLGLVALAIAVPLGQLASRAIARFLAGMINFDIRSFQTPAWVFAVQAGAAVIVPLLAAIGPIRGGTRITVREAITSYGLGAGQFGRGVIDRLLSNLRGISRPLLLSVRNTFRRKRRLALTLLTLSLGSAIFIAVFSVRTSLLQTLDDALKYWQYDVGVVFNRPYRVDDIEQQALSVPGVVAAETWGYHSVRRERPDGTESDGFVLIAPHADTQLLQPDVWRGRWLLPDDENAVVINTDFLQQEPDVRIGQQIDLQMDGRSTQWTVVGIIRGVLSGPTVYANYPYYTRVARNVDRAGSVQVLTGAQTAPEQQQIARALEQQFEREGLRVSSTQTIAQLRAVTISQFNVILVFLLVMAALLAVVGALGLAGAMSINVLERTREIGVMRAVGATGRAVRGIVVAEGALIGVLSWFIGVLIAVPISRVLSNAVGLGFLRTPLSYEFSLQGALIWLAAVIALSAVASLWPARNASRLSVREVLAYE